MVDETQKYIGIDLPFVTDPALQVMGARVSALRASVSRGLRALLDAWRGRAVRAEFTMPIGVLLRMMECALSVEVLASKGRQRDAAVLILTLMELRLDLQYVAQDSSRASVWLEHAEKGRKPWRVGAQIKAIYQKSRERKAELANYQHFSMVKHGNPVGGIASFPAEMSTEGMLLRTDPDDRGSLNLCITCLFAAGGCLRDAFAAAVSLTRATGAEIDQAAIDIDKAMAALNQAHNDHVHRMVAAWMAQSRASDA
jgi:hypothetical protein